MLYSASSRFSSASSRCSSRSISLGRPRLATAECRNQTSGSHSSRAYGTGRSSISTSVASERPDDLEQIAQPRRRRSTRSGRDSGAPAPAAGLAELGRRRARAPARASKSGDVEPRKHQRDRERPRRRRRTAPRADRDRCAASSSSVGCSGSSAYGQNRSSGRYLGGSAVMDCINALQDRMDMADRRSAGIADCAGLHDPVAASGQVRAFGNRTTRRQKIVRDRRAPPSRGRGVGRMPR